MSKAIASRNGTNGKHHPSVPLPPAVRGARLQFVRTLTSSVTTAWGVTWGEEFIARDIMQNFFDANRGCLSKVVVKVAGSDVSITAPADFNLERLFFLGSEKDADANVGQYGEGFKAAATCLLRDHDVEVLAASGKGLLRLRVAANAVEDTRLYPIEYDFFESDKAVAGTMLLLKGCSEKLCAALRTGLNHFFHPANPLLGKKLWESGAFSIYASADRLGHAFYRNLKRGEIDGIPIVLVINQKYAAIEKKIGKDRDRNAFGGDVMQAFFGTIGGAIRRDVIPQRIIVEKAKSCWQKGHPLLAAIARDTHCRCWPNAVTEEVFGDDYFATCGGHHDWSSDTELDRKKFHDIEDMWVQAGRKKLPGYFVEFGVINARAHIAMIVAKAIEDSAHYRRQPTRAEVRAIDLLAGVMANLAPEIAAVFDRKKTFYTVADTTFLLGELKKSRDHHSREVFLSATVFQMNFAGALAIFLHEHAHIFGYDGSRGFTDALTRLIEAVVIARGILDAVEGEWEIVRSAVMEERAAGKYDWLTSKNEDELRDLLRSVPPAVLLELKERETLAKR